jgi:signal transduction histidine kinase
MPPPSNVLPLRVFEGQLTEFQQWQYERLVSVSLNVAALRAEYETIIGNQVTQRYIQDMFSQVQADLVGQWKQHHEARKPTEDRVCDLQTQVDEMRPQLTEAQEQVVEVNRKLNLLLDRAPEVNARARRPESPDGRLSSLFLQGAWLA